VAVVAGRYTFNRVRINTGFAAHVLVSRDKKNFSAQIVGKFYVLRVSVGSGTEVVGMDVRTLTDRTNDRPANRTAPGRRGFRSVWTRESGRRIVARRPETIPVPRG